MISLGCIAHERAIVPVVRNTIRVAIGQNRGTVVGRVVRAKIASIGDSISIGIKIIVASWTDVARVADAIAIGVRLRKICCEGTVIDYIRKGATSSNKCCVANSVVVNISTSIAGIAKGIIIVVILA